MVLSVVTPLAAYFWLDPKLQELRNKAPLIADQYLVKVGGDTQYKLEILNPSKIPVSEIKITINTTAYGVQNPPPPHPVISPASPFDVEMRDDIATLTLKRTLGPSESIELLIPDIQAAGNIKYQILDTHVYSDMGLAVHRNHIRGFFGGGGGFSGGTGGSY